VIRLAYTPQIVTVDDVREFFNPRLTEEEYPDRQLLSKIKAVEYHVNSKYGVSLSNPDTADTEAVIMLVASKVGAEPRVIQKRVNLTREAWVTEKQVGEENGLYTITQSWEKDAIEMLRKHLPDVRGYQIVNK